MRDEKVAPATGDARATAWRVPKKCGGCPFNTSGLGLRIRRGLRPGRWREILDGLRMSERFDCHKTVEWNDDDEDLFTGGLYCAGALEWQEKHGCTPNYARIAERLRSASAHRSAAEVPHE